MWFTMQAWAEEEAAKGPRSALLERLRKGKLADNEELLTLGRRCTHPPNQQ